MKEPKVVLVREDLEPISIKMVHSLIRKDPPSKLIELPRLAAKSQISNYQNISNKLLNQDKDPNQLLNST